MSKEPKNHWEKNNMVHLKENFVREFSENFDS